jgi:ATP-binding cassette, subfamily F, member 3
MLVASVQNVTKQFGVQTVLHGASFTISSGQKLGLIGPNGSGKTTLIRILLGQEPPSDGSAVVSSGVRVGYVPQYVEHADSQTVMESILDRHRDVADALRAQEERLAQASEAEMDKALRAYERARDAYDKAAGDQYPHRARAMLDALGLQGRADQLIGSLSGGEKNVLSLTKALLEEPDLLILDEPANHLDYVGIAWLEDFLKRFKGAVLIVSHNRYLLDRVANGILHLEDGRVRYYGGGYSDYRATHLRNLLAQQADYIANQKRLTRLEALVNKFASLARTYDDPAWGKRLRARRSQLERERAQAVDKPTLNQSGISVSFDTEATQATIALEVRGYTKAFGDLALFENADLDMACGERVALVGPNGSGKTTLLRDIVEQGDWQNPALRIGPSLRVGYGSQGQDGLDPARSILEEIMSAAPMSQRAASAVLSRFLFHGDDFRKRVADLSGGERNRLQLATLMVAKPNFLILDEPTNHLDIPAREAVEDALDAFEGTILVVSHDRYFLDKIVNRVVEVRDRGLVSYTGNFSEFWFARRAAMPRAVGRIAQRRKQRTQPERPRKTSLASEELEQRIADAERRKLEIERSAADAFSSRDHKEGRRATRLLEQVQAELDRLYNKWLASGE